MLYYSKLEKFKNIYQLLNKEMGIILTNYKARLFKMENSYVLNNPDILYKFKKQNLIGIMEKLEVLNPMNTLKRGYAIVKCQNQVISDVSKVRVDDQLAIDLKNGQIVAKVMKVSEE